MGLGKLASRTAELGAGDQSLDTDHGRSGQQRHGAAEGEGGGFRTGEFPHAGQGRHDLAPFEATGAELPGWTSFLSLICCMVALSAKDESSGETYKNYEHVPLNDPFSIPPEPPPPFRRP